MRLGTVPDGGCQQVVDKIVEPVKFDLRDGSLVGKLQCQNGGAVVQGEQVVLGHRVLRVVQREDTEDLGPGLDECEYSPSDSCSTVLCGQLMQYEFALVRALFLVGAPQSRSAPPI